MNNIKTKTTLFVAKSKFYYEKKVRVHLIYALLFTALAINGYSYMLWSNEWEYQEQNHIVEAAEMVVEKPVDNEEQPHKEWIKKTVEEAGLKWKDVECLLRNESGFNEYSYYVNKDKSVDRGLWMWNDKWNKHISNDCSFNYKCSTVEAIIKIKKDGGYGAWYGYTNKCK